MSKMEVIFMASKLGNRHRPAVASSFMDDNSASKNPVEERFHLIHRNR